MSSMRDHPSGTMQFLDSTLKPAGAPELPELDLAGTTREENTVAAGLDRHFLECI